MRRSPAVLCVLTVTLGLGLGGGSARAQTTLNDLQQMSISQLEDLDVMSVTRTNEALSEAPGAIYVITRDQIARSGAKTVPEILRLAPNLQVKQLSASRYIITARGFSGNLPDQNFANKLLVLIDGRSVYTPLFSGVYWDMQDVVAADIERIEVISGPGATLWGANAVNGVINIITRRSSQTQGGLLDLSLGNIEQGVMLRYGGRLDDTLAYRVYLHELIGENTESTTLANAHDNWSRPQGGFRLDWTPSDSDNVAFQGDAYAGWESSPGTTHEDIIGQNLLARWDHGWADGSSLQVIAYYDRARRKTVGGGNFLQDAYNLDFQHSFALGDWNTITWGGGIRLTRYTINGTASLFYAPASRTLDLADVFVQDSVVLSPAVSAVIGLKLEDDPFSGLSFLPSARVSWKLGSESMLWAAASRAVRSPTPFDRDVQERLGTLIALSGDTTFGNEDLTAFELGGRTQISTRMSVSLSAYYNVYSSLRTVELTTGPATLLNLTWGDGLKGHTYGFEAWGEYRMNDWWRLSASLTEFAGTFAFKPGAGGLLGPSQLGDDPERTASLHSSMNLNTDVTLDLDLRYVGQLPKPHVPAFVELNAGIGWDVSDDVHISLSGFNLLHAKHLEFPAPDANAVPRSFSVGLQWRF